MPGYILACGQPQQECADGRILLPCSDKHQPNRGFEGTVSSRNLYVLLQAAPVSVFVELGNIQNTFDQRRFVISSNRQALAKWMTEGFIADYKQVK